MPAKNSIKQYLENGYYHIYNRGVNKQDIFFDKQDYSVFLSYLKEYLLPKDEDALRDLISNPKTSWQEKDKAIKSLNLCNFSDEISLFAFCLMPNHFHLLSQQKSSNIIDRFIKSVGVRYSMYIKRKYQRVGPLFQGVYKAVLITSEEQLLYLTRYIHRQALNLQGGTLQEQEVHPCSFGEYLGFRKTQWIKSDQILNFYYKNNPHSSYESFIRQSQETEIISKLIFEE